ncbi:uncharacterized protein TNCV_1708481 [Trichonephila clavipes]|nr:uncharacterized protein TNCV_1708481 [Trichonephila clavipes]
MAPVSRCNEWQHSSFLVRGTSKRRRRWVGVKGQHTWQGDAVIPNVLQSGTFIWLERHRNLVKMLSVPGWRPMKQGCMRAFLTMWWFSLVYRGRLEPGLRVNDIFRIHWSQHFLTTESELPN